MGTLSEAAREARRRVDREKSRQAVDVLVSSDRPHWETRRQ